MDLFAQFCSFNHGKCLVKAFTKSPGQPLREFRSLLVLNSFSFVLRTWQLEQRQPRVIPGQTAEPFWLACFPPACCSFSPHTTPAQCPAAPRLPRQWDQESGTCPRQSCASTARRGWESQAGRPQSSRGSFPPAAPHITPIPFQKG